MFDNLETAAAPWIQIFISLYWDALGGGTSNHSQKKIRKHAKRTMMDSQIVQNMWAIKNGSGKSFLKMSQLKIVKEKKDSPIYN